MDTSHFRPSRNIEDNRRVGLALMRFQEIMRRHLRTEDYYRSDDALVQVVFDRYARSRNDLLIDPSE